MFINVWNNLPQDITDFSCFLPLNIQLNFTDHLKQQHPFNGLQSGTTRVSRYQKGKTSLDLLEQEIVSGSMPSLSLHFGVSPDPLQAI